MISLYCIYTQKIPIKQTSKYAFIQKKSYLALFLSMKKKKLRKYKVDIIDTKISVERERKIKPSQIVLLFFSFNEKFGTEKERKKNFEF